MERRNLEIDSLNAKIRKVASSLQQERNKQARAKNKSDNVAAKRRALRSELAKICKQLEAQIAQTLPWERDKRLDRAKSLTREIESGNVTEEEAFSRMKSLVNEEIKFGDEVSVVNSPLTRKNGEIVNATILRTLQLLHAIRLASDASARRRGTSALLREPPRNARCRGRTWQEDHLQRQGHV